MSKEGNECNYRKLAVAYYRHSAEDKQENSIAIQREATQKFAEENRIKIVHEEADEGKSGLTAGRPGFISLFKNWIENIRVPFEYVLVFDVSRWGRFQDQDEAGYYEFICKQHGRNVVYVSKGFVKSGQEPMGQIITALERYMAAEYSRQLSSKVFSGCCYIAKQGYSSGGKACFGLDRLLLDENRRPVQRLLPGQHKLISNQRVTFVPKDDETSECVRQIFSWYVHEHLSTAQIAAQLNVPPWASLSIGKWNPAKIRRLLRNEVYIGTLTYNKTYSRLKQRKRRNSRQEWVICPNAFRGIVSVDDFDAAQKRLKLRDALFVGQSGVARVQRGFYAFERWIIGNLSRKKIDPDRYLRIIERFSVLCSNPISTRGRGLRWCFKLPPNRCSRPCICVCLGLVDDKSSILSFFVILKPPDFGRTGVSIVSDERSLYSHLKFSDAASFEVVLDYFNSYDPLESEEG